MKYTKKLTALLATMTLVVLLSACKTETVGDIINHEHTTTDKTAPVITLNGEANITLDKGCNYTELGATAVDDVDGNVSVEINGTVDTSMVGTYIITYIAQDQEMNKATEKRYVNVIENDIKTKGTLLKTGQITSYKKYDDGHYQIGVARNYTRDNDKEVVVDNVTGLMWQNNEDIQKTYREGDYEIDLLCKGLSLAGYNDWRTPSIEELTSIVDYGRSEGPAIDPTFKYMDMDDAYGVYFWTSSDVYAATDESPFDVAHTHIFSFKSINNAFYIQDGGDLLRAYDHIMCVRGGE